MTDEKITAIKGFDKNLKCRGFQFQVGETYEHDGPIKICKSGFHAVEYPMDVFFYYDPANSKYAIVELSGETDTHEQDSKITAARITIEEEIDINEIARRAVDSIMSKIYDTKLAAEDSSIATNTGHRSAATNTGHRSAATNTGHRGVAEVSGKGSVALNVGYQGKAKSSEGGAIVLCYHDDDGNLIHIRASKVGENGIKPDTYYRLNSEGDFEEDDDD